MNASTLHLLLLEDDIDLGQAVVDHLESKGHAVEWMKLCSQAERALAENATAGGRPVQMALLDLRLPDGEGLDVLGRLRARGDTRPVILLTARDQISDRIRGLQAGADDYIVKPFDLEELTARIDAVARRSGTLPATTQLMILPDGTALDFSNKIAQRGPETIGLTAMEWALLTCLASRAGRIWSRADLERALYDNARDEPDSNSLEVLVSRLRRKLGSDRISTHRGLGYRLEA